MDEELITTMKASLKKINIKDRISLSTAIASFVLGWVITFWAFLLPPKGVVDQSVLIVFGQALLYCGTVFGISGYMKSETDKLRQELKMDKNG